MIFLTYTFFASTLLDSINKWIGKTNILIIVLFGGGIIFTTALKAYNINFKQIFAALKNSGDKSSDGISGLQSLMIATSSRIGNGNIAGVASAVIVGGPGALFWMWITALIGMASAFMEGALSQLYKQKKGHDYVGGVPYYIKAGTKWGWLGKVYALTAIATFGLAYIGVQSHTIAANFQAIAGKTLAFSPFAIKLGVGIILGIIVFCVIFGGVRSIGNFASAVIPLMGSLYLIVALFIVIKNFGKTSEVWSFIISGAFGPKQVIGGVAGYTIMTAIQKGAARGVFSNEAGIGSASFAAGASNSKHPVQQGLLQSLSTFIDTMIICSASGFIILYSGIWQGYSPANSATLIQASIASQLGGSFAEWIVFIAVFLFGLTTIIGLYYYTDTATGYLTDSKVVHKTVQLIIIGVIVASSVWKADFLWNLEGPLTLALVVMNIISMLPQISVVQSLIQDYQSQINKGSKQPKFKAGKDLPEAKFWK